MALNINTKEGMRVKFTNTDEGTQEQKDHANELLEIGECYYVDDFWITQQNTTVVLRNMVHGMFRSSYFEHA